MATCNKSYRNKEQILKLKNTFDMKNKDSKATILRYVFYTLLTCVKQFVMIKGFWRLVSIIDLMAAGYFIVNENIYGLVTAMGFAIIAQNISNAR